MSRQQLLELGFTPRAIKHRQATGRLHAVRRGVYAVGRPQIDRRGVWMAAVLACRPESAISHSSAAAHFGLWPVWADRLELSVPARLQRRQPGLTVHRRILAPGDLIRRDGIPVTSVACTIVDMAPRPHSAPARADDRRGGRE